MTTPQAPRPVLIYDGECPLCQTAVRWLRTRVPGETLETLPCQDPARAERFPQVTRAACMEAVQLVRPSGAVLSGDAAVPALLRLTPRWGWLGRLLELPGLRAFRPTVYRWIARNRLSLSRLFGFRATPDPEDGAACPRDSCSLK
jgi:predicted DCC family thiol-disulfide oxidoreductase YuxK